MNKAVTEGLLLSPPDFVDGLDVWSSEDGTIGTVTYDTNPAGSLVASDPDFGDCLELLTAESPQRVRYMGETPILPGCYLEVTARVKLISGPKPEVRISAYPGDASGDKVTGVTQNGPKTLLDDYGRVYTVRAIIGSGPRNGVDLVWGTEPVFGHIGIDVTGSTGAVVRVESIEVADQTAIYHRDLMDWVDVKDFGAVGDGVTNDAVAFETADAAAGGRAVLVPKGSYYLGRDVTMLNPVRFEGTIVQDAADIFVLRANFDFPSYAEAFGEETLGFKKAMQALLNFPDHEVLDLRGRRVDLTEPVDVKAASPNISVLKSRRVLRNGQLRASPGAAWDPDVITTTATYSTSESRTLSNVANVGAIAVGSLVEGNGVGREVYVSAVDEVASEITLSQPLYGVSGTQSFTFTRYKYMLDFSGFSILNQFNIEGVQFDGEGEASGILLPGEGIWWALRNCVFRQTGQRCISSPDVGCNGITVEQNEFFSSEGAIDIPLRTSVALNINTNDTKIRDNRAIGFRNFAVIAGGGTIVSGNHFWQKDPNDPSERTAGLVFTNKRPKACIVGNYIDNHFIEFTNEHRVDAINSNNLSFGRVTITGNIFTASDVHNWFEFIVYSPIGSNHFLDGVAITDNTYVVFGGAQIDRVDGVNTSLGSFNAAKFTNVVVTGNNYESVSVETQSPALVEKTQGSTASVWTVSTEDKLPFGGRAMGVDSVLPHGPLTNGSGQQVGLTPWIGTEQGSGGASVSLNFSQAVRGTVQCRIRADLPS